MSKRGHCRPGSCPRSDCAASPGRRRVGCWWGAGRWGWVEAEAGLQRMTGATWGAMLEASWAWQEMGTGCCHLDGRGLILPCGWSGLILAGCQWWRDGIYCPGEGESADLHPHSLLVEPCSERGEAPWSQLWPRTCLQTNTKQEEEMNCKER